ncbi:MAG: penicillin-binding protein [Lawsonibacter sp.]|nr:penicillin-binding protein [Lawsonibacter sp.]
MESKQFARRTLVLILLMGVLLFTLGAALYDAQIINGEEWAAASVIKITNEESVSSARGAILDRYGRVLVSNRVTYQVTLNTGLMGEDRNEILLELIRLARAAGVEWADSLSVSQHAPFAFTRDDPFCYAYADEEGNTVRALTNLGRLSVKMGWLPGDPTADVLHKQGWRLLTAEELLGKLCASFDIRGEGAASGKGAGVPVLNIGDMSLSDARALAGVLYEVNLRSREILYDTYVFARDVNIDFISQIKEHNLVGVEVEAVTSREYHTDYAAHLLGRVDSIYREEWEYYRDLDQGYQMNDTVGKEGAELAFESYLRGTPGVRQVDRDTSGKLVDQTWITEPEPGDNVVLTLDIDLQQAVEEILADGVTHLASDQVRGAAAVVLDVNSGEVLSAASYPTYRLSAYREEYNENASNPLSPFVNRAFQGLYAPGSTFKMVTAVAGLEMGIITPTTRIRDTGVYTYYTPNGPQCWIYRQYRGNHGSPNVTRAIEVSCNVFFYDVGRQVTIQGLQEYAAYFGLGEKTGIELPEYTGTMAGPKTEEEAVEWQRQAGRTLSVAIGQENSQFTPLQLANYIATLVNGGTHYAAHLLKEVKSNDFSQVLYTKEPEVLNSIEIDPAHLAAVKQGMRDVVTTGTVAPYFRNLDVTAGAKTGSAQVNVDSNSNAVFVCFAPYEEPEIAIAIVVERGGSGSDVGAIAADIMRYYFSVEENREEIVRENTLIR